MYVLVSFFSLCAMQWTNGIFEHPEAGVKMPICLIVALSVRPGTPGSWCWDRENCDFLSLFLKNGKKSHFHCPKIRGCERAKIRKFECCAQCNGHSTESFVLNPCAMQWTNDEFDDLTSARPLLYMVPEIVKIYSGNYQRTPRFEY